MSAMSDASVKGQDASKHPMFEGDGVGLRIARVTPESDLP